MIRVPAILSVVVATVCLLAPRTVRGDVFELWWELPTGGRPAPLDFGDDWDPCSANFLSAYDRLNGDAPLRWPCGPTGASQPEGWNGMASYASFEFSPEGTGLFPFDSDDDGRSQRAHIQPETVVPEPASALVFGALLVAGLWWKALLDLARTPTPL